jgi:hypothetical protein
MLNVIMLSVIMIYETYKPFMLSVLILIIVMLNVAAPQAILLAYPRNTNFRGRLSTVDLLIKVACFVKK